MENPAVLLRRLNPFCARALEDAATLCQTRAHAEIHPEHWLLKLLEQGEGDLTVLARRYEWDMDDVWQDLLACLDRLPRSVRSRPQLSEQFNELLRQAWLCASMAGEEQIRGLHLLMAMKDTPSLLRCDGLWPLLSLTGGQLAALRPLLDGYSEERPDVQALMAGDGPCHDTGGDKVVFVGRPVGADTPVIKQGKPTTALPGILDRFTTDVTAKARDGKIDPVFGRDNEIRQMVDILSRRRKNNPILVGEPGVGKTALVEGLALRIAEGNVPESLKPVILRTLDLGLLQAGAGVKGEFEQRLKNIIDAVQQSPLPVLLFIDEAHTIIGAGNQAGGADAANLLKPALARGELRTIAATTWSEYKQYFERDAALERRFQMVKVDEPDDDTACLMLRGLKSRYAEHHGVHIADEAVRAAVTLSRRRRGPAGRPGGGADRPRCPPDGDCTADPPAHYRAAAARNPLSGRENAGHAAAGQPPRARITTADRRAAATVACPAAEQPAAVPGCGCADGGGSHRRLDRRAAFLINEG